MVQNAYWKEEEEQVEDEVEEGVGEENKAVVADVVDWYEWIERFGVKDVFVWSAAWVWGYYIEVGVWCMKTYLSVESVKTSHRIYAVKIGITWKRTWRFKMKIFIS